MFIRVPEDYIQYIELLTEKGFESNETAVVKRLIEYGIMQILEAYSLGALKRQSFETIIEDLERSKANFFLTLDDISGFQKIKPLSEFFDISTESIVSFLIYTGITTEGYYYLRHEVSEYYNDFDYRFTVDHMPHDTDFESKNKVPEDVRAIDDNEDLFIHKIQ